MSVERSDREMFPPVRMHKHMHMQVYIHTHTQTRVRKFSLFVKDLIKYFPLTNLDKCSLCNNAVIVEVGDGQPQRLAATTGSYDWKLRLAAATIRC